MGSLSKATFEIIFQKHQSQESCFLAESILSKCTSQWDERLKALVTAALTDGYGWIEAAGKERANLYGSHR